MSVSSSFFSNLPALQTRQALLLLDFQNDFVRDSGRLHVNNTQDFIDQIPALAQSFRRIGDVVWVRTQYESPPPLIDQDHGGERIVLAAGSLDTKKTTKKRERGGGLSVGEEVDPEAFLSGPDPACRPQSSGVQFPAPIVAAIDPDQDFVIVKSDYSALQSPGLVLSLRSRLVTELYLCGSLSNVSVYATALDAARQGFTITLIEDCLGFRSFARHEEAMRRMADIVGANGITLQELVDEHEHHETASIANAPPTPSNPSRGVTPAGIEGLNHLDVHGSSRSQQSSVRSADRLSSTPLESIEIEPDIHEEEEDEGPTSLPNWPPKHKIYTRAAARTARETQPDSTNGKDEPRKPTVRMRRPKKQRDSPPISRPGTSSRKSESSGRRASSSNASTKTYHSVSPAPPTLNAPSPAKTSSPVTPQPSVNAPSGSRPSTATQSKKKKNNNTPDGTVGPNDEIGEGDSYIMLDVDLPLDAFYSVRDEVQWQKMYHLSGQVPRLVAVQGDILPSGSIPIYRHPADESPPLLPFSPIVNRTRKAVEKILGHPLNHVLIQRYRDGNDNISEHSDKTLDIVRGSCICNVSLGAQRTMVLRTKTADKTDQVEGDPLSGGRKTQRVPMSHSSLFVLGEKTNRRWLHGIRPDRRPASEKSSEKLAFEGERISLTFRHIGTFLRPSDNTIWGQGAVSKDPGHPRPVIHGEPLDTEQLIHAFGRENREPDFDWDAVYGVGFDVVNFVTSAVAMLVPSDDEAADFSVRLCMTKNGMRYVAMDAESVSALTRQTIDKHRKEPVYINPKGDVVVTGATKILSYLAQMEPISTRSGVDVLRGGLRLNEVVELRVLWRKQKPQERILNDFDTALSHWNRILMHGQHYLNGPTFGIDDCALWSALREIMQTRLGIISSNRTPLLYSYYRRIEKRGCVKVVREEVEESDEDD